MVQISYGSDSQKPINRNAIKAGLDPAGPRSSEILFIVILTRRGFQNKMVYVRSRLPKSKFGGDKIFRGFS